MHIDKLGWNAWYEKQFEAYDIQGFLPARVIGKYRGKYMIYHQEAYKDAKLAGKFRYKAKAKKDFPAVGDWVAIQTMEGQDGVIIQGVLKRKSAFVRKQPISGGRKIRDGKIVGGMPGEQIIASNINTAFIVSSLDGDFNLQRLERYITLVYNSGANPVVILNKMDLCDHVEDYINQVGGIALGLPIHAISVEKETNMDIFNQYLIPEETIVFLGSSGVGKSTITNYLLGEEKQDTKAISIATGKGRHTTTSAELVFHPSGTMIIDTPGLRELQLWGDEDAVEESFEDIVELALNCKFNDCSHRQEPGCAVKQGIEDGHINQERYDSYIKQVDELREVNAAQRKFQRHFNRQDKLKMHGMK